MDTSDMSDTAKSANATLVKPVSNAIRILRHLSQVGKPERSLDIARQLSINPSTCFNILRTLVQEDVVDFSPLSKRYSVGSGLARLVEGQGGRVALVFIGFPPTSRVWKDNNTLFSNDIKISTRSAKLPRQSFRSLLRRA